MLTQKLVSDCMGTATGHPVMGSPLARHLPPIALPTLFPWASLSYSCPQPYPRSLAPPPCLFNTLTKASGPSISASLPLSLTCELRLLPSPSW